MRAGGDATRSRELGHPEISPRHAGRATLSPAAQQLVEIARALASGARVLVLDEPTSSLAHDDVERLFDLIAPAAGAGPRDRLHLALHRGSEGGLRPVHRAARRPERRRRPDRGDARRTRSSQLMVGRRCDGPLSAQPRAARRRAARAVGPAAWRGDAHAAPRRDRRHRRTGRRRPHAAAADDLRARGGAQRTDRVGRVFGSGVASSDAGRRASGMLSENRKAEGLATGLSIADNVTLSQPDRSRAGLPRPAVATGGGREPLDRAARHPQHGAAAGGRRALGRQPAEGRARAPAAPRRRRAAARRADARDRRRQQGADLRAARRAGPAADRAAARRRPRAILMVSSYLPELLGLCDRIAVMCRGRLGPARPTSEWTEHSLLMDASGAQAV